MGTYWMEPFLFNSVYIMETPGIHDYIALRNAQIMHSFQPEAIVSFVPATQELSYLALKFLKKEKEIPLYTVITDMVSMRHNWIMPEQAYSFVPTEEAKTFFVERGIAPEKMQVTGLPVHPRFYQDTQTRELLQQKHKLDPERFTILIIMGANGSKSIYTYCKLIESLNLPVQIIACCGTSHVIKSKVEIFAKISSIPIHAFGFTREIADLMKVSDLLITKPGSVSIAESISQNLPIFIDASTYIMWQEKGNDEYIEKHQLGKAFRSPDELAQKLTDLVNHREKYTAIKQTISDFPRQNAAEIIARHLVDAQSKP